MTYHARCLVSIESIDGAPHFLDDILAEVR
jgi:hypothetical protein